MVRASRMLPALASVVGLLRWCGPSDVPRFVIPVHIDSVDAEFGTWRPSDMGQESGEIIDPLGADANASASIEREALFRWVQAPSLDSGPGSILFGYSQSAAFAVLDPAGSDKGGSRAAAASDSPISEMGASDNLLRTAFASAQPLIGAYSTRAYVWGGDSQYGKFSKYLSGKTDERSHSSLIPARYDEKIHDWFEQQTSRWVSHN